MTVTLYTFDHVATTDDSEDFGQDMPDFPGTENMNGESALNS